MHRQRPGRRKDGSMKSHATPKKGQDGVRCKQRSTSCGSTSFEHSLGHFPNHLRDYMQPSLSRPSWVRLTLHAQGRKSARTSCGQAFPLLPWPFQQLGRSQIAPPTLGSCGWLFCHLCQILFPQKRLGWRRE